MAEIIINESELREKALGVVNRLKEVAQHHQRNYPASITAVLVLSGAGTYYDRLKPGQGEHLRWKNRDGIRAGVAVVREITAQVMTETLESGTAAIRGHYISKEDILEYGPYFVYNGTPLENTVFRQALRSPLCSLPQEKVLIIDEVYEDGSMIPIRHTGDQFKSLYQAITNPNSPLFGVRNVSLIAHISDFARNLFYAKKYTELNFWVHALKNRPGTEQILVEAELARLPGYAAKGDLATEPAPFST